MARDLVTRELREEVLARDGYRCVAPILGAAGVCRDAFGNPMERWSGYRIAHLELDHVKDQPRMGKRAESDPDHLVTLCAWHHRESGWATSHRPELREYLRRKGNRIYDPAIGPPTEAAGEGEVPRPERGAHL